MMQEKVRKLTAEYDMLPPGGRILCAVSGGADSMCLLHLLSAMAEGGAFQIAAAHFDHRLRGAESSGDAAFVAEWCARHNIRCALGEGDVAGEAMRRGLGVEETARQMRYAFLQETAEQFGCCRIATAHNAEDNAETILLHLARGTGLHGLTGIPPRRGDIVRPLLTCTRVEIEDYLTRRGIPHREDSSNTDEAYSRNKLRARVIPVLRELNPRFAASVAETLRYLRTDDEYLNAQADAACARARWEGDDLVIEAAAISGLPAAIAPRAARRLLEMQGDGSTDCSAAHLNAIVDLARGEDPSAAIHLPGGRMVQRVYRDLLFTTREALYPAFLPVPVAMDGETDAEGTPWRLRCRPVHCPDEADRRPGAFYVSRGDLIGPLTLRPRQQGDSVTLPRRSGSKTLKKLFIEERVPRREREHIPVLADRMGVLAVAGFGPDVRRLAKPGEAAFEFVFIRKKEA